MINTRLSKKKICLSYARSKNCQHEDKCYFLHLSQEEYQNERLQLEKMIASKKPKNIIFLDGDNSSGFLNYEEDSIYLQQEVHVLAFFTSRIWNTVALSSLRQNKKSWLTLLPTITDGKDAADHALVSYVFRLDMISVPEIKFIIVSEDKFTFEVVWQLRMLGRNAFNLNSSKFTLLQLAAHHFNVESLINSISIENVQMSENTKYTTEYVLISPHKYYHATLIEENGIFTLKAGSIFSAIEAPTLDPKVKRWRAKWKEESILKEKKQHGISVLELLQDQKVPSLNFARKIIQGSNTGPCWKVKDQQVIKN